MNSAPKTAFCLFIAAAFSHLAYGNDGAFMACVGAAAASYCWAVECKRVKSLKDRVQHLSNVVEEFIAIIVSTVEERNRK